jgi:hypothetical protein
VRKQKMTTARQTRSIPRQLSQKSLTDIVRPQVSGGSAEEVDDEPDRGGRAETGNPEACDQPGRGEELHDGEHPPPVAGESDAVEAGDNGPWAAGRSAAHRRRRRRRG